MDNLKDKLSNLEQKASDYAESFKLKGVAANKAKVDFMAGYLQCQQEYEEKLHWIPVETELPKKYSAVLAVLKSPSCTWVEEIGYGEGKFHLPGRGDTDFVTHWMYLPEPPPFL